MTGGCQGSINNNCYPLDIWSGTPASSTEYHDFSLNSGTLNPLVRVPAYAFTVRCVLDLDSSDYGLRLCDAYESSKYGTVRCAGLSGSCQGSYSGNCWAYHLWSGTVAESSGHYRVPELARGAFGSLSSTCNQTGGYGKCIATWSFSVRCVVGLMLLLSTDCQLCEYFESSKYGAARCFELGGGCQGSSNTNCYPHAIWSASFGGANGYPYHAPLDTGVLHLNATYPVSAAFSVRCVLDLIPY